jgi:hypothetical protein
LKESFRFVDSIDFLSRKSVQTHCSSFFSSPDIYTRRINDGNFCESVDVVVRTRFSPPYFQEKFFARTPPETATTRENARDGEHERGEKDEQNERENRHSRATRENGDE